MKIKNYKFIPYRFVLQELITYFFFQFSNFLLAPLYFHFGHYPLFIDIMTSLTDMVDTIAFFFLLFFFLISVTTHRDTTFFSYAKTFYKNYSHYLNRLPLYTYFSNFFSNFSKLISFFSTKISNFLKKKK